MESKCDESDEALNGDGFVLCDECHEGPCACEEDHCPLCSALTNTKNCCISRSCCKCRIETFCESCALECEALADCEGHLDDWEEHFICLRCVEPLPYGQQVANAIFFETVFRQLSEGGTWQSKDDPELTMTKRGELFMADVSTYRHLSRTVQCKWMAKRVILFTDLANDALEDLTRNEQGAKIVGKIAQGLINNTTGSAGMRFGHDDDTVREMIHDLSRNTIKRILCFSTSLSEDGRLEATLPASATNYVKGQMMTRIHNHERVTKAVARLKKKQQY